MAEITIDEKDNLTFNVFDLLEKLDGEHLIEFCHHVGCFDTIIEHVAQQIVHGWTDEGRHGAVSCDPLTTHPTPLDKWSRYVADNSNETARKAIESLASSLAYQTLQTEVWRDKYFNIYHNGKY